MSDVVVDFAKYSWDFKVLNSVRYTSITSFHVHFELYFYNYNPKLKMHDIGNDIKWKPNGIFKIKEPLPSLMVCARGNATLGDSF